MQTSFVGILGIALGLVFLGVSLASAQQSNDLMPYIGETKAQFDARRAGLPQPATPSETPSVTIPADPKGNFFVDSAINNTPIRMVVDTGANYVALSEADARNAGIEVSAADFKATMTTANGTVMVAPVLLNQIAIGEIVVNNVPAIVVPENKLPVSLLGMSFLSKLSYINESGGLLTFRR